MNDHATKKDFEELKGLIVALHGKMDGFETRLDSLEIQKRQIRFQQLSDIHADRLNFLEKEYRELRKKVEGF